MKILQLCHKSPYPPADGGTIAMNNITQGLLHEGFSVKVLAVETPKHHVRGRIFHKITCKKQTLKPSLLIQILHIPVLSSHFFRENLTKFNDFIQKHLPQN